MLRRAALVAFTLVPMVPAVAWAQVTPDRAAMLQRQIQDWLENTLALAGRTPVRVTAADDHFDVAVPLGIAPNAPVMTGKMTDAGSGRWAVDDITVPSPSVFHYQLPPSKTPGTPSGEVVSTLTVGAQQQHMLLDPSFTTPSSSMSALKDLSLTTTGMDITQLTHIDAAAGTSTVTPASDGRVDVAINSALEGYTVKMSGKLSGTDSSAVAVAMGKVSLVANLAGVSRERAIDVVHAVSSKAQRSAPAAMDRQKTAALLAALADLARGVSIDEKVNDLTVTTSSMTGTLKQLSIGLTSSTAAGKIQARVPLAAEGLALPDIGLGSMASFIPTKLAFTPTVGSVPTEGLMRVSRKLAEKQDPASEDVAALFSQGPITAGIEDFSLDVGGAEFTGAVSALVSSPNRFTGTGRITAVDIDKLQQAMAADPQTAQFAPVVIFLKGISRSEQSRLVWDLIYNDGRLLVNGQDMAALMGPAAPPAQAQPQSQPRPRPQGTPARPAPTRP
ncbi:MAG: hypothetical protein M3N26_03335 [Pseudomonadota bacterium]|nr:hypothetical protein [Pseudomonadota bacterium]